MSANFGQLCLSVPMQELQKAGIIIIISSKSRDRHTPLGVKS
jgi:hypothetical protein